MKTDFPAPAAEFLHELTTLLPRGRYEELEARSKGVRMTA